MGEILKAVYEQQLDGAVTTLETARAEALAIIARGPDAPCPYAIIVAGHATRNTLLDFFADLARARRIPRL